MLFGGLDYVTPKNVQSECFKDLLIGWRSTDLQDYSLAKTSPICWHTCISINFIRIIVQYPFAMLLESYVYIW